MKSIRIAVLLSCAFSSTAYAFSTNTIAINNLGPSPGAIFDLNGQPIEADVPTLYTASFTADSTITDIAFQIRNDLAYSSLSDISVVDNSNPTQNIVGDGRFANATLNTATDTYYWQYSNIHAATYSGLYEGDGYSPQSGLAQVAHAGVKGDNVFFDGSTGAYDQIAHDVTTIIGDTYTVSFYLDTDLGFQFYSAQGNNVLVPLPTTYSQISTADPAVYGTHGGNGIDLALYATDVAPVLPGTIVPEPGTPALLGLGLAGMLRRRYRVNAC